MLQKGFGDMFDQSAEGEKREMRARRGKWIYCRISDDESRDWTEDDKFAGATAALKKLAALPTVSEDELPTVQALNKALRKGPLDTHSVQKNQGHGKYESAPTIELKYVDPPEPVGPAHLVLCRQHSIDFVIS